MIDTVDTRLLTIFRQQAGVISRGQARAHRLSDRQIKTRVDSGQWIRLRRGVYRHVMFADSVDSRVHALTIGGRGFVSHRHAAKLHGLDPVIMRGPEVTLSRDAHDEIEGVIVHQTTQFRQDDMTMIDGFRVSTVERTIMDCAAVVRAQWIVLALIDSARESGLTDLERLDACLVRHARRGRDGTVRFREALEMVVRREPPAASPFSRDVAAGLQAAGLPYPRLEEDIRTETGALIARVDLSWEGRVVVFLDGFTYHGMRRAQTNRDRLQRHRLRTHGYNVLEFTWDQWREDPGFVVAETSVAVLSGSLRTSA